MAGANGKANKSRDALEAELLGQMIRFPNVETIKKIIGGLNVEYFRSPRHRYIFGAILYLHFHSTPINLLFVADRIKELDKTDDVPYEYIAALYDAVPTPAHAEDYAERIISNWGETEFQRLLLEAGQTNGPPAARCRNISNELLKLSTRLSSRSNQEEAFPRLIPASELAAVDETDLFLWEGFVARNSFSLLTGLWKAGKTTLIGALLNRIQLGMPFLDQPTRCSRVIVVSEEHEGLWAGRRDRFELTDAISFLLRPFSARPTYAEWVALIRHLTHLAQQHEARLIILDPLSGLWNVENENDASQVNAALMPLRGLLDQVAILGCHHPRKGDGKEATSSRGSGALPAFADILIELRRAEPEEMKSRKRIVTAYGRFETTPPELLIELAEDGVSYKSLGNRIAADLSSIQTLIQSVLPVKPPGMTKPEILENWPEMKAPRGQRLIDALHLGINSLWFRTGSGHRGDPFRFLAKT
jgi:hypothetical protein